METFRKTVEEMERDAREKLVIDLRKEEDFEKDSYDGSVNIYWEEFEAFVPELPKDKAVYLICYTGETSDEFAQWLQKQKYEAYSLSGGYRSVLRWKLSQI